jgi:hypothetical protein
MEREPASAERAKREAADRELGASSKVREQRARTAGSQELGTAT